MCLQVHASPFIDPSKVIKYQSSSLSTFPFGFRYGEFINYWVLYAEAWGELNTKADKSLIVQVFLNLLSTKIMQRLGKRMVIISFLKSFLID